MRLAHVEIESFRGIRRLRLEFDAITALIGENSWGKTSFLDALALCLGAGVGQRPLRFGPDDFHVGERASEAPAATARISLGFRESRPGEWDLGAAGPLAPAVRRPADGPPEIVLRVTARRADDRIDTTWSFLDGDECHDGRDCDAVALQELRRRVPILWLRATRPSEFPVEAEARLPAAPRAQRPADQAEQAAGAGAADSAELRVARVYRRLVEDPHRVRPDELRDGLDAVGEIVGTHPDLIGAALDAPASRREGSATRRLATLVLLGALLEARGAEIIAPDADPIVVLEDPEAHLHPTLLATLWGLIERIPAQKIVTTNSGELLAWVPLRAIRRLVRRPDAVRAHGLRPAGLPADSMRRIGYHLRVKRAAAMFARCWLLVEGESEVWLLPEVARLLGIDFASEGIHCIEFAQCGVAPLVELAHDLGIEWHLLADGDRAGRGYVETAHTLLRGDHPSERITRIRELDLEHLLWRSGFSDVYLRAAGPAVEASLRGVRRETARRRKTGWVIGKAIRATSKPELALAVAEEAAARGAHSVPGVLRDLVERVLRQARAAGV